MKYKFYLVLSLLLANTSVSAKAQPIVFYSKRIVKNSRKNNCKNDSISRYIIKESKTKSSKDKNVASNNRKRKAIKKD